MTLFTDFVPDKETQFWFGWQMIGVMVLNMCLNVFIVLAIGIKGVILLSIRFIKHGYVNSKIAYRKITELSVRL